MATDEGSSDRPRERSSRDAASRGGAPSPGRPPSPPGVDFAASTFSAERPPDSRTTFAFGDRIHWRARFGSPVGASRLDLVTVISHDGWERVVSGHELWLAHPRAVDYAGWLDSAAYRTPGRFVLRFVRGADVVAEGEFEVVPSAGESAVVH